MDLKAFHYRHPGSKYLILSTIYGSLRTVDLLLEPASPDHRDRGNSSSYINKLDSLLLERYTMICIYISPPWQ